MNSDAESSLSSRRPQSLGLVVYTYQFKLPHLGVVAAQVRVVDAVELDGVVDVRDLADVELVSVRVVERLLQLLPPVPHHQHALRAVRRRQILLQACHATLRKITSKFQDRIKQQVQASST